MAQRAIPYVFMRGGTSRGPYFRRADLPQDQDALAQVLIAVIGAGHPINIDGIGGGIAVTTKVAMLSKSDHDWADIDYFFAQVGVDEKQVDFKPTCGNILSAVGAAAVELGLYEPKGTRAEVKIRAVNTGALVKAGFDIQNGAVIYDGAAQIAGVRGTAAPIELEFMEIVGSATGKLLPTGNLRDDIQGINVSCVDVAMPMVVARAESFGLTGYESREALDKDEAFFMKMEAVRVEAGALMGMGDVSASVTPKFGLLAQPKNGGSIAARYFMPWTTHPSMAVTGAQCIAACALMEGSVADGLIVRPTDRRTNITIEHASGNIDVLVEYEVSPVFKILSAGLVRTARKLADGHVYVPEKLNWE